MVALERASKPLLRNPGPCGRMEPGMGVGSRARVPAQPPRPPRPQPILAEAVCWAGALRGASEGRGMQVALYRPWWGDAWGLEGAGESPGLGARFGPQLIDCGTPGEP